MHENDAKLKKKKSSKVYLESGLDINVVRSNALRATLNACFMPCLIQFFYEKFVSNFT